MDKSNLIEIVGVSKQTTNDDASSSKRVWESPVLEVIDYSKTEAGLGTIVDGVGFPS